MPRTYRFDPSDYEGLKYTCIECRREFPSHDALDNVNDGLELSHL